MLSRISFASASSAGGGNLVHAAEGDPCHVEPGLQEKVAQLLGNGEGEDGSFCPCDTTARSPRRFGASGAHSGAAMSVPERSASPASGISVRSATSHASIAPWENPPRTRL